MTYEEALRMGGQPVQGMSYEDALKAGGQPIEDEKQGLLSKLGNRAKAIGQEMGNYPGSMVGPGDPLHVLGQVAGGINDVAVAAAKGLYRTVVPEDARKTIGEFTEAAFAPETPVGGPLASAARGAGKIIQKGKEVIGPEASRYVEDVVNIAGAVPIVGGAVKTALGTKNVFSAAKKAITTQTDKKLASKPYSWLTETVKKYDDQLSKVVAKHYSAAASPTTVGKRTFGKMERVSENTTNAVNHIVQDNLETGIPMPKTLEEASKAIDIGINKRLKTASAMTSEAGEKGIVITGQKAINDALDPLINNTNIAESTVATAQKIKDLILKNPARNPVDMEELIRTTNNMSKPFYRAGDNAAGKVAADASKALRSEMIDTLKSAGPTWQKARNEVRDLMSMQDNINKSWGVDLRKKGFGFMDMGNIYSMGEIGAGIAMQNPTMLTRGLMSSAMKTYMKYMNQKNTQIGQMFEKAEKIITRKNKISEIINNIPIQGAKPGRAIPTTKALEWEPGLYQQKRIPYDWKAMADRPPDAVLVDSLEGRFRGKGLTPSTWAKEPAKYPSDIQDIVGMRKGKTQVSVIDLLKKLEEEGFR